MKLPTLYKTSSKGATQVINMEIVDDVYTLEWGQLNGKMQVKSTTALPKNVGKKNETTGAEQAIIEAKAVWAKKKKAGYSLFPYTGTTVNLPMKVSNYDKYSHKVVFPCYVSVKLDGVNCEYRLVNGKLKLLSRGGEEYPIPEHQRDDAIKALNAIGTNSINGEMYIYGAYLQDITGAVKKPNELSPKLKFYAFDFPTIDGDYTTRCAKGYKALDTIGSSVILPVMVGTANSHEDLHALHDEAVSAGYEGIIIRNATGLYKYNTRSMDVLKLKQMQDAEFKVVGFDIDKNKHPVYQVETASGATFSVKRRGTSDERLKDAQDAPSNIGKWLTVSFERYSKDGIPLKPVGGMFRKVDESGEALE